MTTLPKRAVKALVCLFFLLILLVGVLTVDDYGRPWDELGEIAIFRTAIMEYGEWLPFETSFHQNLKEAGVVPISQTIERDHNFSLYYPIAWAAATMGFKVAFFIEGCPWMSDPYWDLFSEK